MLYSQKNTALPWHIRETNCIDYRTRAHPRMVFTKSKTTCYLGSCLSIQHSGAQVRSWFGGSRGPVVGLLQASLSFSGPQITPKLMSRSITIRQYASYTAAQQVGGFSVSVLIDTKGTPDTKQKTSYHPAAWPQARGAGRKSVWICVTNISSALPPVLT